MMSKTKSYSKKKKITNFFVHLFLAVLACIWIFPILRVIMTSLRAGKGAYSSSFFPDAYTFSNYTTLFTDTAVFNFPRWFGNTFVVAIFSCILATFYLVSIAYTMSRLRFKARKPILNISLILGMFPGFMSMIAVYYIMKGIGLVNGPLKLVALVLLYSGGAIILQFYVAKGFCDTIPTSIDEAAYMYGAPKQQVFTQIYIPLANPMIIYTVLPAFIAQRVEFILAK